MHATRPKVSVNKITLYIVGMAFLTLLIIGRLFSLQVLQHKYYQDLATREQNGVVELPAQRGEIIIKDHSSNEEFPIATNTTLNLLYADPTIIKNPQEVADKISPLIFSIEDERAAENERISKQARSLAPELSEEDIAKLLTPMTDQELEAKFKADIIAKISLKKRAEILLATKMDNATIQKIRALNSQGIETKDNNIYAYPPQISNTDLVASQIASLVQIPSKKLSQLLKGENRYVVLKVKLPIETSQKIQNLIKKSPETFAGIGMQEQYFRYYPENTLAANVVGYVNGANMGQYGIESSFNTQLQGITGKLQTNKDSIGRQITVGESTLEAAVDGDDIILTLDRSVEMQVEKYLAEAVKNYRADSGQIIIQNPQNGAIIAMANYPTFNPNAYGDVFKKIEISLTPQEIENLVPTKTEGVFDFYVNTVTLDKYPVFATKDENGNMHYYRYDNFRGPEVYHNKTVSWPYEPGSAFKTIAMAAAIDDGDVTPNTTFNDSGPIQVDWNKYTQKYDFEIRNSHAYFGLVNMTTVIAESLNTGMTFVAKKMGGALFYSYLKKFGFLDRTDIEFEEEAVANIEYFEDWTESELATHSFGQGMTVTMIQLVNAYSAIANGGVLMQPYIVDEVRHDDGSTTKTEPHEIRRVISEDTASKMISMLTYSTENGVASPAKVPGHFIAGKTGTSQTYKHGIALSGTGTTIATFAGFAPVDNPKFTILIKLDHPRVTEWGANTAAPTFSKIAEYLFDYYNIPPDKK